MYGLNVIAADRCESISEFIKVWNGGEIKKNNAEIETVKQDNDSNAPRSYTYNGGNADIDSPDSPKREVAIQNGNNGRDDNPPEKPHKSKLPVVISVISVLTIVAVGAVVFMMNNPFAVPDPPPQISKNTESSEIVSEVTHEEMEVSVISHDDGENKDTSPIEPEESPEIEETSVITPEESKALAIKEYLDRADVLVSKKNYSDAYTLLKNAIERFGSDSSIISKQSEIKQIECKEKISELESSKSYGEAIVYMDENKSAWENDMDYVEKYSTFVSSYRNSILSEAEKLFHANDIDSAIKKLNEGLAVLESDDVLEEKQNEYANKLPISLFDIKIMKSYGECSNKDIAYDPRGEKYENVLEFWDNASVEYYTGKNYSVFSCIIVPDSEFDRNDWSGGYFEVYADEKLIYTSELITYKTKPISVNVDIKNAEYLVLKVKEKENSWGNETLMVSPYLYK